MAGSYWASGILFKNSTSWVQNSELFIKPLIGQSRDFCKTFPEVAIFG